MPKNDMACLSPGIINDLFNDTYDLPAVEAARVVQSHFNEVLENLRELMNQRNCLPGANSHPNGFTKIQLHRRAQRTVRLHLWASIPNPTDDIRIHGHAWSMASLVLRGAIVHTLFHETSAPDCERYHRYWYTPGTSLGSHSMTYDDLACLGHAPAISVASKQIYSMSRGEIHSSIAAEPHTATLMFSDRSERDGLVPVYSKKYFPNGYSMDGAASSEIKNQFA